MFWETFGVHPQGLELWEALGDIPQPRGCSQGLEREEQNNEEVALAAEEEGVT